MNQFLLQQGKSDELMPFPYIMEFALKKNQTIRLESLPVNHKPGIRVYYIIEGKFTWNIDNNLYVLYPGDTALILPGRLFGGEKDFMDIGTVSWLELKTGEAASAASAIPGGFTGLSPADRSSISKILTLQHTPVLSGCKETGELFNQLAAELFKQEIGFTSRTQQLVDELFILFARQLTRRNNSLRNFPQSFMKLEQTLRNNLSHQWTVPEMAALVGLGTTAFTEKVKSYTGFSPLNYLINIRISEAIKLLKRTDINLTDIALDTGFYSSQHFSTTFKKLTGYTPSQFKKNMTTNN